MSNGDSSRKEQEESGTPTPPIKPIEEAYVDYANDTLAGWEPTKLSEGAQALLDTTREAGAGIVKTTGSGIRHPLNTKKE